MAFHLGSNMPAGGIAAQMLAPPSPPDIALANVSKIKRAHRAPIRVTLTKEKGRSKATLQNR
ncbi:MAG: hypothetical protein AAGA08_03780 [Pseudomonadota bacterium]